MNTGRVGRRLVELLEGRHALLGELVLVEPADHPHPLRRRRARGLLAEHAHGFGERRHAVPAQLHVVVEAAADHVRVAVHQAGNDATPADVDHTSRGPGKRHDLALAADGGEAVARDRHRRGLGLGGVEGGELAVPQDQGDRVRAGGPRRAGASHQAGREPYGQDPEDLPPFPGRSAGRGHFACRAASWALW